MEITRIDKDTYLVGRCTITRSIRVLDMSCSGEELDRKFVDGMEPGVAWAAVGPSREDQPAPVLFVLPTLDEMFDFCEGARRLLAPA